MFAEYKTIMNNAIIWGLDDPATSTAISELSKEGLIDIKAWFGVKKKHSYVSHDCYDFQGSVSGLIVGKYIKCEQKMYKELHNNLVIFSEMTARSHQVDSVNIQDILGIFALTLNYFNNLISETKATIIIFGNIPHEGPDYILYQVAKYYGLKVMLLTQSLFPNRFFCVDSIDDYGIFSSFGINENAPSNSIPKSYRKNLFYMNNVLYCERSTILSTAKEFIKRKLRLPKSICMLAVGDMRGAKRTLTSHMLKEEYRRNSIDSKVVTVDLSANYVYFPLHLQPEMTTSALGGIYCDQMLAIEELSAVLPEGWYIYVKENPKQGFYGRGSLFFERLGRINNVKYILNHDTYELIENCKFVATITGTAGWEAISGGKNVIVFGKAWYSTLPGVFPYSDQINAREIANNQFSHEELQNRFNRVMERTWAGVIDSAYAVIVENYDHKENNEIVKKQLRSLISRI